MVHFYNEIIMDNNPDLHPTLLGIEFATKISPILHYYSNFIIFTFILLVSTPGTKKGRETQL